VATQDELVGEDAALNRVLLDSIRGDAVTPEPVPSRQMASLADRARPGSAMLSVPESQSQSQSQSPALRPPSMMSSYQYETIFALVLVLSIPRQARFCVSTRRKVGSAEKGW
jgi:hypothetical protein